MKKALLNIILLFIVFSANAQLDTSEITTKLKDMEIAWNKSVLEKDHGYKIKNDILAEDFYKIDYRTGKIMNKEQTLKYNPSSKVPTSIVNEAMYVNYYGNNVATVIGSHITKGIDSEGKKYSLHSYWIDTYMNRNDKWQCISSAGTDIVVE